MDIYVGNLPFTATEEEVAELFAAFGPVEKVKIVTDRETGRPRGFCFVTLADTSVSRKRPMPWTDKSWADARCGSIRPNRVRRSPAASAAAAAVVPAAASAGNAAEAAVVVVAASAGNAVAAAAVATAETVVVAAVARAATAAAAAEAVAATAVAKAAATGIDPQPVP